MNIYEKASELLCYTDTKLFRDAVDFACITEAELDADPGDCNMRISAAMEELYDSEF